MFNKITTIIRLICNVLIRRRHYLLTFVKEDGRWYYDFKNWGFAHANLEMVAGADDLCELYSKGQDKFTINIVASRKRLEKYQQTHQELIGEAWPEDFKLADRLFYGRNYESPDGVKMWICPVTLFVLGRYPNYLYVER